MRYEKGLSYKFTSLNDDKRLKVLHFLNNQSNATDAIHTLILNHIAIYGDGDIRDLQMIQPLNQPVQNVQVDTSSVKPMQAATNVLPKEEQTVKHTETEDEITTNESSSDTPIIDINNF